MRNSFAKDEIKLLFLLYKIVVHKNEIQNANIWVMSLLFIMSGVFCTANCFASVLQCLNIMLENETGFEFVFGHFLLKRKEKKKIRGKKSEKKYYFFFF